MDSTAPDLRTLEREVTALERRPLPLLPKDRARIPAQRALFVPELRKDVPKRMREVLIVTAADLIGGAKL